MWNKVIRIGLVVLVLSTLAGCRKYYGQRSVVIPDNSEGSAVLKLIVQGPRYFEIQDLDVEVWIDHPNFADLEVWIESPLGTVVPLFNDVVDGEPKLIFNDQASRPFGSFKYEEPGPWYPAVPEYQIQDYDPHALGLFVYNGEDPRGWWELHVRDRYPGNTGTVELFGLCINGEW
ncbi:MAG: hypothetical protein HUU46_12965 [Candidatus Hydrogenedentes bacterium]|nr:hypothetical protein [Candidatus Hydrogenedentota bacterium]